jgi:carboxyl-terminal processing protease
MIQQQKDPGKGYVIWLPLFFSLVLVIGMVIGMRLQSPPPSVSVANNASGSFGTGGGKVEELIRYIEAKYVDDVNRDQLVEEAIDNILAQLDPHSTYLSAEKVRQVNEQLEGNFDGIGIEFLILDDTIRVINALEGGPSAEVGILPGDKIVMIEDSLIAGIGITNDMIMEKLRGKKGDPVAISVLRPGTDELLEFTVVRDIIPMHSVDVSYMMDQKTGYLRINRFSATTSTEFFEAVQGMVEEGMEDLIIDLRANPGGYLQEAADILSLLFDDRDQLLVYTEGRSMPREEHKTTGRTFFDVDDIVVLQDEDSASASEILSGAIQDYDRGVIVGRRSFGKGLVQKQYYLRDGSAVRLTVARYYTPSGRSIQRSYEDRDAYHRDVLERYESGELYSQDSIPLIDSTVFYTSNGREVYGGGGIVPDVFVSLREVFSDPDYQHLRAYVPGFVFRYLESEKGRRLQEMTLDQFDRSFQPGAETFDSFIAYAEDKGVVLDDVQEMERNELLTLIKARIAKHLYGDLGFYKVLNASDPDVIQAMDAIDRAEALTQK